MGSVSAETSRMPAARPHLSGPAHLSVADRLSAVDDMPGRRPPGEPGVLPVLPALRELLPRGGLPRGSVVTVAEFGLLALALAAGASAAGAWCGIAGVPEAGVLAAAALGLDTERTLLIPDPGPAWAQ